MASTKSEYGLIEWLRAHRVGLGPAYLGLPVLTLGLVVHFYLNLVQLLFGLGVLAISGGTIASNRPGQLLRKWYFVAITVFVCAWIAAAWAIPDIRQAWVWLIFALVCGGALMSMPWWADQLKRTHVRLEHIVRSWPTRAERIGVGDIALADVKSTPIGWAGRFRWLPGAHTVEEVLARQDSIEGALGLQAGQLRMPKDGKSTNSVRVVVVTKDPHAVSIPWEIPVTEINGETVLRQPSIADGCEFGIDEEGRRQRIVLFKRGWGAKHLLVAGMKGSGKSGFLNIIWGWLACCTDVVQWGIDLKGGMELGPWAKAFDWMATSRDEAAALVATLAVIIDRRAEYARRQGWKVWQASAAHPVIVLSIDEAASLLGESATSKIIEDVAELARKGRAVGIVLIMATQKPTVEAVGSTQIRSQFDQLVCFRMQDSGDEAKIITAGRVNAHKIDADRPGTCYWQDGDKLYPMPLRTYLVADATIDQLVSIVWGHTPALDEVSATTAESVNEEGEELGEDETSPYSRREIEIPTQRESEAEMGLSGEMPETDGDETGETDEGEMIEKSLTSGPFSFEELEASRRAGMTEEQRAAVDERRAVALAEPERLSTQQANDAYVRTLVDGGSAGVTIEELCSATTRSRSWVYDKLMADTQRDAVNRTKEAKWAWSGLASVGSDEVIQESSS